VLLVVERRTLDGRRTRLRSLDILVEPVLCLACSNYRASWELLAITDVQRWRLLGA
ncbi:hypothetical protein Dimus_035342, partial [Dionaea muscipula]